MNMKNYIICVLSVFLIICIGLNMFFYTTKSRCLEQLQNKNDSVRFFKRNIEQIFFLHHYEILSENSKLPYDILISVWQKTPIFRKTSEIFGLSSVTF